ncbi:hypothetical protein MRB53_005537 [Persea americana]|uniref:Uncharacterized protein n=1 Tax=Persea americana TaxID=3435 RepID=A0ACC2MDT2_PERAE|nr:hypothetical protein MRB53_005537 [Persea americana]
MARDQIEHPFERSDSRTHQPTRDSARTSVAFTSSSPLPFVRSKNSSDSRAPKSGRDSSLEGGLCTTHKNLCPLLSNPIAISLSYATEKSLRLTKHKNTMLRLNCESSHSTDPTITPSLRFCDQRPDAVDAWGSPINNAGPNM